MTGVDDTGKAILRNMLLGRWAAEKLGMTGQDAEAYSDALARATVDPAHSDVFSRIRRDFDAAGVDQSDEEILRVMTELTLKAGNLMPTATGSSVDAAAVSLARKLTPH
ncbi:ATPase inhibitor subunit zeta [Microvirga sp. M2]|uniref:ATPase inhibitor subunit zeta n=1 Tax=Microvirga sp. M2 TaxID=3073270 RepID=UPI0039C09294